MPAPVIRIRFEIDNDSPYLQEFEEDLSKKSQFCDADTMEKKPKHQRGNRVSRPITVETFTATADAEPSKCETVSFFSGNPFVEKTQGILHLYRKNEIADAKVSSSKPVGESLVLCMVAVPSKFTSHDLLQFFAPYSTQINKMRIIRDSSPNQYMVLVEFRQQESADDCFHSCNNKPYNGIEKDICHLVYVNRVEMLKEADGASLSMENYTELPTCPVCLERMDESVDGILTVLCNHTFHGSCISQWSDTSCPVCRYSQTPELIPDQMCSVCRKQQDLWICLICGHIGCGRYAEAHAYLHYQETQHTFSLEVGGQRVWDYVGDNYVHRLILSKSDGKLVEFDNSADANVTMQTDEKVDAVTLEYTYLLTNQLESQRLYFEERLAKMESMAYAEIDSLKADHLKILSECDRLREQVKRLTTEKQQLDKRFATATTKLTKTVAELKLESDTNVILREDQQKYAAQVRGLEQKLHDTVEEKNTEIAELQEQVRDLLFHFNAETQLETYAKDQKEDLASAEVRVGETPPTPAKRHIKKRHK